MNNNPPQLPEGYTKASVLLLMRACEHFFPVEIFGETNTPAFGQGSYGPWENSTDFREELFQILPNTTSIKEAHELLKDYWLPMAPEKFEGPVSNVPANLNELVEKYEKAQNEEERKRAEKEYQLKRQQELEKSRQKSNVVYIEPKETSKVKLSPTEEFAKTNFEQAANQSPQTFVKTFSEKIIQNLPPEVKNQLSNEELKVAADQVALDFLNRVVNKDNLKTIPAGIFKSLLESGSVEAELKKEVLPILTTLTATSEGVVRSFLYPLIGKNLTDHYYDEPQREFRVTTSPTQNSLYRIDLNKLNSDFSIFKENPVFDYLKNQAKDQLVKHGKKVFEDYIVKIPQKGIQGFLKKFATDSVLKTAFQSLSGAGVSYQATNITGWVVQVAAPDLVPVMTFAAQRFGINIGITAVNALTPAATAALETGGVIGATATGGVASAAVAGTVAGEAAAVTAGAAAGATAGAAAGATAGGVVGALTGPLAPLIIPIATAVGAFATKILDKIKIWLKRNPNAIKYLTLLPVIAGIATGSGVLITVGGVLFVGTFVVTGGVATAGTAMAGFLVTTMAIVMGATIKSVAKPLVLSLIGTVAFAALVLFIINSGAYIVPPDTGSSINIDQNPYIKVTKEADVTSTGNPPPSKTVNYTVTVSAPLGSITNIAFQNGCTVIRNGATPTCSAPLPGETPQIIDPATPFVFTYSQTYDTSFSNSLITDTFSVTATTPQGQATSISSASVIIGTPPTGCFNVVGSNWPANKKANILSAIGTLTGSFSAYSAKLCSGGTIKVIYDTTKNPGGWGYYGGGGNIYMNGGGLDSSINALYILAHESGHHYQSATAQGIAAMVSYLNNTAGVATERPLCSYVNTGNPYEAFAEAIALYVTRDQSSQWTGKCSGTFQSTYPNHYNFVRNNIF